MKEVTVSDKKLQEAAAEGMDAFVGVFVDAINNAIGNEITTDTMSQLNSHQITLLAWNVLHEEVMDGGYIQLIHNGYGGFIFRNPFAAAVKEWGLVDLCRHIRKAGKFFNTYHTEIEADYSDDDFMALFERYPQFDDFDDDFVENEELWTGQIAHYIDEHIDQFAKVVKP